MSTVIDACIITQCRPEYSDNLLPTKSTFEETISITKTGGSAFSTAVQSTEQSFDGSKCIKMYVDDNVTPLSFNFGNQLEFTTIKDSEYIFSLKVMHDMPSVNYYPDELRVYIFLNGINTYEFVFKDVDLIMQPEKWYTISQAFTVNVGVVVDFTYRLTTSPTKPLGTATMFMDGFKLEADDRYLGLPSVYSQPTAVYSKPTDLHVTETQWDVPDIGPQDVANGASVNLLSYINNGTHKNVPNTDVYDELNIVSGAIKTTYRGAKIIHTIRVSFNIITGSDQFYQIQIRRDVDDSIVYRCQVQRSADETIQTVEMTTRTLSDTDPFTIDGFYIAFVNNSGSSATIDDALSVLVINNYQTGQPQ